MKTTVQKWGNSLAVRIPKSLAEDSQLEKGAVVDMSLQEGRVVLTPVRSGRVLLDELLRGVTTDNMHGEFAWGKPKGREAW